ncbi:MAG: DUF2585 family protein [Acidobacteriota bacterium]
MNPEAASTHFRGQKYLPSVVVLAAFAAAAVLLHFEGRLWMCACGKIQLWSGQVCSANNSQHLLDPYSFTHLLHGFVFFWLITWLFSRLSANWQLALAVAIEACWEVFENTNFVIDRYRSQTAALGYNGDTVINSFGDILCCVVGFVVARRLGLRRSLIVFVVLEVVLIFWIKDSLLLEILTLIIPIDAVRAWQMCR